MKKIIFLLSLIVTTGAAAQNLSLTKIGITYSFDQQSLPDRVLLENYSGYSAIKNGNNNFTAGISTEIALVSRLSLRTGLLYSNKDYQGYFGCPQCHYDYTVLPSYLPEPETIIQRYLDIPVVARYYFIANKFSLFADLGVNGNFLVENRNDRNNAEFYQVNANNFMLSAEGGVGVSYTIIKYIEISITTVYRTSLTNYIPTDEDMKFRSLGIVGGLSYRFRNARPE